MLACWAVGDQVFIGVLAGEAKSPRMSMGHATKLVPYRVIGMYMISVVLVTFLVPSDSEDLLGGSGVTASPFVLGLTGVGIKGLPDLLNAGMICGVLAIAAESTYLASRMLRTMAHQQLIPEFFAHVDSKGRPRRALMTTSIVAIALTYMACSGMFERVVRQLQRLILLSKRHRGTELVHQHHKFILLLQLAYHRSHLFQVQRCHQSTGKQSLLRSFRLEVH